MVTSDFYNKNIFLDTAPLIYFIEGNSIYQNKLMEYFIANDNGAFTFYTSCITLLEVLVKPLKEGNFSVVNQYKNILLNAPGIEIFEISKDVAEKAALLRAKYGLRTPDAIQIATSLHYKADYFLTNDQRLTIVSEISIVGLSDLN